MVKTKVKSSKKSSRPEKPEDIAKELSSTLNIARKMDAKDIVALKRLTFGYAVYGAVNAIEQMPEPEVRLKEYKELMKLIAELDAKVDTAK